MSECKPLTLGDLDRRVQALEKMIAAMAEKEPPWVKDLLKPSPVNPEAEKLVDTIHDFDVVESTNGLQYCRAYEVHKSGPTAMLQNLRDAVMVAEEMAREYRCGNFSGTIAGHGNYAIVGFVTAPDTPLERAFEIDDDMFIRLHTLGFYAITRKNT